MIGRGRTPKGEQPRLSLKAPTPPSDRYAYDPEKPHPAAQADAMGATVLAYLITGPLMFGGLGWLVDRWLNTTFCVYVGAVVGMGLSIYTIWLRYGSPQAPTTLDRSSATLPGATKNEEIQ